MGRRITDKLLEVSRSLPAAAANNNSTSLDLGEGWKGENYELEIEIPALPNLADTKTLTVTVQDSADNSAFAAIPELATLVVTGAGGVGSAATKRQLRIPASTRQYIRINCAVASVGGDNTASAAIMRLLL